MLGTDVGNAWSAQAGVLAEGDPMNDISCPELGCELPADVLDRTVLESTDGPVEHVRTACSGGHWFFMPSAALHYVRRGARPVAAAIPASGSS